jgi:hypothetical protein
MRTTLTHDPAARNPATAVERLPNPDPLTMDYAARKIASRYNVTAALARVVAELVGASLENRR